MPVQGIPVTDKVLESLKRLPALKHLSLDATNITDRGAAVLQSIPTLESLDLYHTPVTRKAYESLQAALPNCRIFFDEQSASPNRRVVRAQ